MAHFSCPSPSSPPLQGAVQDESGEGENRDQEHGDHPEQGHGDEENGAGGEETDIRRSFKLLIPSRVSLYGVHRLYQELFYYNCSM